MSHTNVNKRKERKSWMHPSFYVATNKKWNAHFFTSCCLTMSWFGRMFLLLSQLYLLYFSPPVELSGQQNIWIEMTSISREHFIWLQSVLYILSNGNMSGLPSWFPLNIAKNDTAYSQHCLHPLFVPMYFGCHYKYSTHWVQGLYCFQYFHC